ncbi:UDP-N-acetylmuramyl pentapeptide phosphotransferase/UDP-N-acetylglucosamine-1-phosphate transferase [Nocardiopsis metallicus]|uniref:UDP-N-acetylmuramyl pentapeptide phosphotransferase/UDP-N-acetylglucosamine-1-phosphate transferase n=1 Tax=Nocardiopsis metallicus TaxID=179819 RepID=A0A840W3X2_9ACTN|nr:UDP-N-acetylmuramyl pentapeptide phosphotransferase/UDP-N-acetylglucosamine-1-phosphate transferase [Nocardiopsis metallicus]
MTATSPITPATPATQAARGLAGAALGALAARSVYRLLNRDGERSPTWQRVNFRGRTVTLQEGPALVSGVCAGCVLAPGLPPRVRAATTLAAAGSAVFGAYDDLAGDARAKGLRGHLGALAHGQVTTGAVKMAGIGATGLAAASLLRRGPLRARIVDTLADGALIAASANLVNLFDLRPGRAVKFALLASAPALASPAAAVVGPVLGASAALLPDDLAERSMLGDAGANALGAALGAAAAARAPRPVRLALLGGVVGLTLLSERVSFSKAIDRVPALRRLDRWGRLDPDLPGAATESAANAEAEPADAAANGTRTEAAAPGPDGVRGRGAAEDDPTGVPRARRSAASPAPG